MTLPPAEVREKFAAAIRDAAAGHAAWLDKIVRKAGYVPAANAMTRKDVRAACDALVQVLAGAEAGAESECCKETIHRLIETISTLAAAGE
jgi:hypothetical protein